MPRPFLLIGKEYRLNDRDHPTYQGVVFASDEDFYFVGKHAMTPAELKDQGGFVGMLGTTAAAMESYTRDPALERTTEQTALDLFPCAPDEVPRVITTRPEWIIEDEHDPVLKVPRRTVLELQMPAFWLNNRLSVRTEQIKFGVVFNPLRRFQIKRFLGDHGWALS
jgi:hypothetical protein